MPDSAGVLPPTEQSVSPPSPTTTTGHRRNTGGLNDETPLHRRLRGRWGEHSGSVRAVSRWNLSRRRRRWGRDLGR